MDGNEQNLLAAREGIGVGTGQLGASISLAIPQANSRKALDLSSIPLLGKSVASSLAASKTTKTVTAIKVTKKKVTDQIRSAAIVKRSTSNGGRGSGLRSRSSLGAMMHRMNNGKMPDAPDDDTEKEVDMESQPEEGWEDDLLETLSEEDSILSTDEYGNTDIAGNNQRTKNNQEHGKELKRYPDTTNIDMKDQENTEHEGNYSHDTTNIDGINRKERAGVMETTDFVKASELTAPATGDSLQRKVMASRFANPYPGSARDPRNQTNVTVIKVFPATPNQGTSTVPTNQTTVTLNGNLKENPGSNTIRSATNLIADSQGTQETGEIQSTKQKETRNSSVLKIAPGRQAEEPRQQFFTYTFQLTFQQPLTQNNTSSTKTFYVPENFRQFFRQLRIAAPDVLLHPYNDSGTPITHEDQLPEGDIEVYNTYYHNHSITPAGHLTGMCVIMLPLSWSQLKNSRTTFFKWLQDKKVFMKYTSFKADQLSAAGWFFGFQPDVIRKEEVLQELRQRLEGILPQDLLFQLAPRYLRVAEQQGSNKSFNFKAVAVECDRKNVRALQEALYQLGNPKEAKDHWPVTGRALFIPFLATEAWQHHKILGMAKAQEKEMNKLGQLFINNVGNIDTQLQCQDGKRASIRELLLRFFEKETPEIIHSVHNTNREGMVSVLYYKEYTLLVESTMRKIHEAIEGLVHPDQHTSISLPHTRIELIGRQSRIDSSQAKVYATYADEYLENPQGGEEEEEAEVFLPPLKKQARRLPPKLSYSTMAKKGLRQNQNVQEAEDILLDKQENNNIATPHKLYDGDSNDTDYSVEENLKWASLEERFQERFEQLEKHFEVQFGKTAGITIEEAEAKITESNKRIQEQSEKYLDKRLQEFSLEITGKIAEENAKMREAFRAEVEASQERMFKRFEAIIEKQNGVVLQTTSNYEQQFDQIFQALGQQQQGQNTTVATRPRGATLASGEKS